MYRHHCRARWSSTSSHETTRSRWARRSRSWSSEPGNGGTMARRRSALPMTIKQVADHLGVAQSSVSRALNDHPDVSEEMKQRVHLATEELGYEPDYLAQSLRRGATKTVGFVLRDISNPLFADLVR